jgi:16S rRNA (guanine1516-N2)-methyltransferase
MRGAWPECSGASGAIVDEQYAHRAVTQRGRPIVETVNGRVEARFADERPGSGVVVDFATLVMPRGSSVRSMPIVRACGRELAACHARLVDATAGLGYDAYVLSRAGFDVVAIERSSEVARLLADGLRRASQPFALIEGDAKALLAEQKPDVVYLDPMYPAKRRASALPPKEMQIVRALVGDDDDARELLALARAVAPRVVVKRPLHAKAMDAPTSTIEGKLARFDVYVR